MRVIARKTLKKFWIKHADSEASLKIWFKRAEQAAWKNLSDLKKDFPGTDFTGNDRYIFNIKGNNYRLIAKIDFEYQLIFIRFVGTHAEYDKINSSTI